MKYIGKFCNLDDKLYTVYIITNRDESISRDITLSDSPFSTEMDTSDDNIYKPVKYQSATVGVVTSSENDYMFNVYSGEAKGTAIRLYDEDNNLVWGGFATPVVYNNGYTSVHENLEIEAIDGLSILQYYKYHADNKEIRSFIYILTSILSKCEVYDELYVSASIKKDAGSSLPLLNHLYISEQNFFDEKDDKETDDDVAWTCKDVLEEICQYLGLVCVGDGNKVYLLDYDAIRNGNNTFWKYQIGSTTATTVTKRNNVSIEGSMYRGTGSNISLDNVYNKISVKDDFYTFDDIIPDIYDTAYNVTKSSDPTLQSSDNINNGIFGEVVQGVQGNDITDSNNNMICMVDRVYDPENEMYTHCNAVFVKYFNHPYYNFYGYNGGATPSSLNYTDTKNMHGAVIAKFFVKKLDQQYLPSWMDIITGRQPTEATLDMWMSKNQISKITLDNYVMLINSENKHIQNKDILKYPYFETKTSDTTALFGGENAYLVITGSYIWHYVDNDPYPIPSDEVDISEGRYAMKAGQTYLLAKLQWGNKYWDGDKWTTTNSVFKIPYLRDDSSDDDRRADHTMFASNNFVNSVSWRIGINESGYLIPLPQGTVMSGLPKFTMYKPFDPEYFSTSSGDDYGQWYKHNVVLLKNFSIKAVIGDPSYSNLNDSDTVYTNIIDEHHIQELDEIKCKICTNDGKKPNYSSVGYSPDGNTFEFLDRIYNANVGTNGVVDHAGRGVYGLMRPEEWIVHRLTKQYQSPKIRLELELNTTFEPYSVITDKWLRGKSFIVDAQSTNYYTGQTTVTVVEKG